MKITLGIPTNMNSGRGLMPQTMQCLLELISYSDHEFNFELGDKGYTIAENRTYISVKALRAKSDYLFFVDDDMTFPPDTLERLLKHDKDIVGVVYRSRGLPAMSTVVLPGGVELTNDNIPKEDLIQVQHTGTGVMLVNTKVYQTIAKPWFDFTLHDDGYAVMGEDVWFCKRVRHKGGEVWCDTTIEVGHIGQIEL